MSLPETGDQRATRRSVLKTALLAAGSAGLAGCSGGDGGGSGDGSGDGGDGDGGGTGFQPVGEDLTAWHAMGGELGETLDQIATDFEDETGIAANMEFQESYENVLTNLLAAFESGSVPDMAQVDSLFAKQVLDTDQVQPVEEIMPEDFDADAFLKNVSDFFVIDDQLASLPFNNSNAIMYYNRDAFEAAGLDPDDPPTTLAEVRAASEQLVDEGVTNFGITWPNHVWFVEHWYSFEGELMTDAENGHAGDPSEFRTPDAVVDFYDWWKGMADDGLYTNPGIEAWGEATSLFTEQESAMLLTSTAFVTGAQSAAKDFEVDNAPYPSISETRVGPVIGGASFYVPAGLSDERYDDIGQLLQFIARPETQIDWHQGTGYYPNNRNALEQLRSEGFYEENPMFETAIEQLQAADIDNPATKRILLGPARSVQTTIQNKSVDIINADDIEAEIQVMKEQVEEELSD
jgi:sn-glycerol 3-phosphate transport system substrate-binding protein